MRLHESFRLSLRGVCAATVVLLYAPFALAASDSDGDGLPDAWESANGYDPLDRTDAARDLDADGLDAREEYAWGTQGNDRDTDTDTAADGREVSRGISPVTGAQPRVDSGNGHTCAVDDTEVVCWGAEGPFKGNQATVPPLLNPRAVSAGSIHTCALDDTGAVCWGDNNSGKITVPPLSNPVAISAGYFNTCSVDDSGVKCWGDNTWSVNNVPPLSNPASVSVGAGHACAVDDSGVVCWGKGISNNGQVNVPPLTNPRQVSAGYIHTCALDDTGVVCWGFSSYGLTKVPPLSNPVTVSAGEVHNCAMDDTGVVCWGYDNLGQTSVPPLSNPIAMSAGQGHTCALDDTGVVCWGDNAAGQTSVPALSLENHARAFPRMVALPDVSADTVPDLAVVRQSPLRAEILSGADGSLIRTIPLFDGTYHPLNLDTLPDVNGDGSPELIVVARSADRRLHADIVNVGDAPEGRRTLSFAPTMRVYRGFTVGSDMNGNGSPELVLMAELDSGAIQMQVKDALTDEGISYVAFGTRYDPIGVEVVSDQDALGAPDLAMIGTDSGGRVRALIRDPFSKQLVGSHFFDRGFPVSHSIALDQDLDGNNEVFGVLGERNGGARTQLRHLPDGAVVARSLFGTGYASHELFPVPDENSTGTADLMLLQSRGPRGSVQIRDGATGSLIRRVSFTNPGMPRDAVYIPASGAASVAEIAYLAEDDAGVLRLQIRPAGGGQPRLNTVLGSAQ